MLIKQTSADCVGPETGVLKTQFYPQHLSTKVFSDDGSTTLQQIDRQIALQHQQQQNATHFNILKKMPSNISTTTTSGLGGSNLTNTNISGVLSSSLGSQTQPPTPSPRRKISTSSFTENLNHLEYNMNNLGALRPFKDIYQQTIGSSTTADRNRTSIRLSDEHVPPVGGNFYYGTEDYIHNIIPSGYFSNENTTANAYQRPGYFGSNYFPYRPEQQLNYERDCKSYPDYTYNYDYNLQRLPNYYNHEPPPPPAPTVPVSLPPVSGSELTNNGGTLPNSLVRTSPPRAPKMGISSSGHRRTPSTLSNNSLTYNQSLPVDYDDHLMNAFDYGNYKAECGLYNKERDIEGPLGLGAVPPPTKQELYKNSPKPSARYVAHRIRDYENLPTFNFSPLHKSRHSYRGHVMETGALMAANINNTNTVPSNTSQYNMLYGGTSPKQQQSIYNRSSRSTPMSPIHMRTSPLTVGTMGLTVAPSKNSNSACLIMPERPDSLPFDQLKSLAFGHGQITRGLRSSLKKYNNHSYKTPNGTGQPQQQLQPPSSSLSHSMNGVSGTLLGINTANNTPTNPTPPDSLTSDDSSYLSAKEGSSVSSHSRVRFSPEAYLDASPGNGTGGNNAAGCVSNSAGTNLGANNNSISDAQKFALLQHRRITRRHHRVASDTSTPSS